MAVDKAEIARGLQRECRLWLVMWSAYRRTYTGFACFTREAMIVDEEKIDQFLERVKEVEKAMFAPG